MRCWTEGFFQHVLLKLWRCEDGNSGCNHGGSFPLPLRSFSCSVALPESIRAMEWWPTRSMHFLSCDSYKLCRIKGLQKHISAPAVIRSVICTQLLLGAFEEGVRVRQSQTNRLWSWCKSQRLLLFKSQLSFQLFSKTFDWVRADMRNADEGEALDGSSQREQSSEAHEFWSTVARLDVLEKYVYRTFPKSFFYFQWHIEISNLKYWFRIKQKPCKIY